MVVDLLLKDGTIVTPTRSFKGTIAVKDGKIVAVGENDFGFEAKEVVSLAGKHIFPGVIDPHVHISWPNWDWEEDCVCTTKTAAAGGVTTIMHYLNMPMDLHEELAVYKEKF